MKFCKHQELEALADPMRKEVAQVRKKIDAVNKELKPLGHTCQKKVTFGGRNSCVDKHCLAYKMMLHSVNLNYCTLQYQIGPLSWFLYCLS